jgi:hypothetical protein
VETSLPGGCIVIALLLCAPEAPASSAAAGVELSAEAAASELPASSILRRLSWSFFGSSRLSSPGIFRSCFNGTLIKIGSNSAPGFVFAKRSFRSLRPGNDRLVLFA